MKTLTINFDDLYHPMHDQTREINDYYLDTETGELIYVDAMTFSRLEEDEELEPEDIPQWMEEDIPKMKAILEDQKDRYLNVPAVDSHTSYDIMRRFIPTVEDEKIADALWDAINQRKPFRRFKDVLANHPDIFKQWDAFEEDAYKEIAAEWLKEEGFTVEWK